MLATLATIIGLIALGTPTAQFVPVEGGHSTLVVRVDDKVIAYDMAAWTPTMLGAPGQYLIAYLERDRQGAHPLDKPWGPDIGSKSTQDSERLALLTGLSVHRAKRIAGSLLDHVPAKFGNFTFCTNPTGTTQVALHLNGPEVEVVQLTGVFGSLAKQVKVKGGEGLLAHGSRQSAFFLGDRLICSASGSQFKEETRVTTGIGLPIAAAPGFDIGWDRYAWVEINMQTLQAVPLLIVKHRVLKDSGISAPAIRQGRAISASEFEVLADGTMVRCRIP